MFQRVRHWRQSLFLIFICVAPLPGWTVEVSYHGFTDALEEAANAEPSVKRLAEANETSDATLRRLIVDARRGIEKVLQYYGYYKADLREKISKKKVKFKVRRNKQVRVTEISLRAETTEGDELLKTALKWRKQIKFSHQALDKAKSQVLTTFLANGYLKARFRNVHVRIRPDREQAKLVMWINEGTRYRFGELQVTGMDDYPTDYFRRWLSFRPGQFYSQNDLMAFYQRLQASGDFQTINIDVNPDNAQGDTIPVIVELTPIDPNLVKVALGFSTDVGPHIGFDYERYNVSRLGHRFLTRLSFDTKNQQFDNIYTIPSPLREDHEYRIVNRNLRRILPDSKELSLSLGYEFAAAYRTSEYLAGLKYDYVEFEGDNQKDLERGFFNSHVSYQWRTTDSRVYPAQGYIMNLENRSTVKGVLSRFSAFRFIAGGSHFNAFFENRLRLIKQLNLGYTLTPESPEDLPTAFRFFAGGSQSVRGYDFNKLAPRNNAGEIVGGKGLFTTTLQTEWRFGGMDGNWGMAVFGDYGGATDDWSTRDFGLSVGFGARWYSPVIAVNMDLAFPLRNSNDTVMLVFSLATQ